MIKETGKFKVVLDNPWIFTGDVSHKDYLIRELLPLNQVPEDYPDIFSAIYELEDGTEVCFGDPVWREKNGVVKQVQFSEIHVDKQSKVFGSAGACEKWLEKNANNIKTELLKQNHDSSFQTLKSFVVKLEEEISIPENISIKNIIQISEGLSGCVKNIESLNS